MSAPVDLHQPVNPLDPGHDDEHSTIHGLLRKWRLFNVADYQFGGGAVLNGDSGSPTDDSAVLIDAIAAADAAGGGRVHIPAPLYCAANVSASQKVRLSFDPGAYIKMASGKTLTTQAPGFIAGEHKIFDLSAGGFVVGPNVAAWWSRWFGVLGDGVTNDSAALLAWLATVSGSGRRATAWLGAGIFLHDVALPFGGANNGFPFIGTAHTTRQQGSATAVATLRWIGGADSQLKPDGFVMIRNVAFQNFGSATNAIETQSAGEEAHILGCSWVPPSPGGVAWSNACVRLINGNYSRIEDFMCESFPFLDIPGRQDTTSPHITTLVIDDGMLEGALGGNTAIKLGCAANVLQIGRNVQYNARNAGQRLFSNTAIRTTVSASSDGATLPTSTINVGDTTGFPIGPGAFFVRNNIGQWQKVFYAGMTGTTLTGCTGGKGTISAGALVLPGNEVGQLDILCQFDNNATGLSMSTIDAQNVRALHFEDVDIHAYGNLVATGVVTVVRSVVYAGGVTAESVACPLVASLDDAGSRLVYTKANVINPSNCFGVSNQAAPTSTRTVSDGVIATDTSLNSATALFGPTDIGRLVSGVGIAANTYIQAVNSSTNVTLSKATTATSSGVSVTISGASALGGIRTSSHVPVIVGSEFASSARVHLEYGDPSMQTEYEVNVLGAGNFTTNVASHTDSSYNGNRETDQQFWVTIWNNSGAAMGTVTWGATFQLKGAAPASPGAGQRLSILFRWDNTIGKAIEITRTAAG